MSLMICAIFVAVGPRSVIPRGDTMQKWHIFRKNEKFSKRNDGFLFRFILFKASDWGYK